MAPSRIAVKIPIRDYSRPPEWVTYQVPPERQGLRLDHFLAECLHWRSRNQVQDLIRTGKIKRNGGPVKKSMRLNAGDAIDVKVPPPAREPRPDLIPIDIVYEDEDLLCLNKSAGVVCHPVGQFQYETLVNALHWHFAHKRGVELFPQLCHRLDRETSGLLLIAKTPEVRALVQSLWEQRRVEKRYLALVRGRLSCQQGSIEAPLAPHPDSPGGLKMHVDPEGQRARTDYRVIEDLGTCTLVELDLKTGRQHQIRAHMSHLGHPLLADTLYLQAGGAAPSRWRPEQQAPAGPGGLCRQALHASQLAMLHPVSGARLQLEAPLAPDIVAAIEALRAVATDPPSKESPE